MTAFEIHDYISRELADHSKRKLTRVLFKDGSAQMGHLFAEDQNVEESRQTNKWNYRALGGGMIQIDGNTIDKLKAG